MTARSLTRIVYPITGLTLIVVAWALGCWLGHLPVVVLPSPDKVLYAFAGNMRLLLEESWVTLKETLYGFGLALVLGLPMAVAVANSRTLNLMFYPLLIALQSVPKVALAPIILVWLGPDLQSKLAIAWLVAFFPIIVDTAAGLRATPKELLELAHSLKATRTPDPVQGPVPGGAAVRDDRRQGGDHARRHRRGDRRVRRLERRPRLFTAHRDLAARHATGLRRLVRAVDPRCPGLSDGRSG